MGNKNKSRKLDTKTIKVGSKKVEPPNKSGITNKIGHPKYKWDSKIKVGPKHKSRTQ